MSRNSFDGERLKKIRKDFNELRDKFSKPQMKEIRKNLYDIKNFKKYFNGVNISKKLKKVFLNWKSAFLILRSIAFKMTLNTEI